MLIILGFLLFLLFPIIGFLRTVHGVNKCRKCAEFSFIKWTLGGISLSMFSILLHSLKYNEGNNKALIIAFIGFSIATIIAMIVEKILLANTLKKEKIENKKTTNSSTWN